MGYKIVYQRSGQARKINMSAFSRVMVGGLIFIVAISLVAYFLGWEILDSLLPGNGRIAGAALNEFAQDLKAGEPVQEAFVAFCQEILDYAYPRQ